MPNLQTIYYVVGIAGVVSAALIPSLIKLIKWAYRQFKHNEETRDFVYSIATNHLPHIYVALEGICEKLDVPLEEHPPIESHFQEERKRNVRAD